MSLAEKRARVRDYQSQGLRLRDALEAFALTRHQYYHQPALGVDGSPSRPGVAASTPTDHFDESGMCTQRENAEVVQQIEAIQEDDDLRCGYKRMTAQLELRGYRINRKKVYRLMKQHELLLSRANREGGPYVTHRCAQPAEPLRLFEMDIKMFWVEEHRRYAFVLTVLDTFTRVALDWQLGYSMKWTQVRATWERIIEEQLQEADLLAEGIEIEIRSDNGPQFLATKLREFFVDNHLDQVFTHPYTPQENGYVESFHSILSRATRGDTFWTLQQLEQRLTIFYEKYNNSRVHTATALLPPRLFWEAWQQDQVVSSQDKRGRTIFKLKQPGYLLSGNLKQEAASRLSADRLEADLRVENEVNGPVTNPQPQQSVKPSPSAASR